MGIPYRAPEEANDRIAGTVIMYGDDPVYVIQAAREFDASRRIVVSYLELPADVDARGNIIMEPMAVKKAPIVDEKWRAHDLFLGYVNISDTDTVYLSRRPVRRYKQGLNPENILGSGKLGKLTANTAFIRMLRNDYPSYDAVVSRLLKSRVERCEIAFARRWSLEYTELEVFWLRYRGHRVASSADGKTFRIPKKFFYLSELILELGLELNV